MMSQEWWTVLSSILTLAFAIHNSHISCTYDSKYLNSTIDINLYAKHKWVLWLFFRFLFFGSFVAFVIRKWEIYVSYAPWLWTVLLPLCSTGYQVDIEISAMVYVMRNMKIGWILAFSMAWHCVSCLAVWHITPKYYKHIIKIWKYI